MEYYDDCSEKKQDCKKKHDEYKKVCKEEGKTKVMKRCHKVYEYKHEKPVVYVKKWGHKEVEEGDWKTVCEDKPKRKKCYSCKKEKSDCGCKKDYGCGGDCGGY